MKILTIALKDLRTVARDYKALALIIAMPLILIFILGSALGPMFEHASIMNPFKIAVVDFDRGETAQHFIEILESEEIRQLITVEFADTRKDALHMMDDGDVSAAVIIPQGISGDKTRGKTKSLTVLTDPAEELKGSIVSGIVETFVSQYSMVYAGTEAVLKGLLNDNLSHEEIFYDKNDLADMKGLGIDIGQRLFNKTIKASELLDLENQEGDWITGFQYYTAGMLLMFTLFGAMLGVDSIISERENRTLMRMFCAGVEKTHIIIAKTLGTLLICCLQILILILFTRYVFGVEWGASKSGVFLISLAVAFACTGFAILIASISNTKKMADAVGNISVQAMAILGGCTFPIFMFPKALQHVSRFTITRWGLQGYLALMEGRGLFDISQHIMVLAGMGIIFMIFGIWRLRLE